jgi:hypothetical protein
MSEVKAPSPTLMSMMRELVTDSTDLATAMLEVPTQVAKAI